MLYYDIVDSAPINVSFQNNSDIALIGWTVGQTDLPYKGSVHLNTNFETYYYNVILMVNFKFLNEEFERNSTNFLNMYKSDFDNRLNRTNSQKERSIVYEQNVAQYKLNDERFYNAYKDNLIHLGTIKTFVSSRTRNFEYQNHYTIPNEIVWGKLTVGNINFENSMIILDRIKDMNSPNPKSFAYYHIIKILDTSIKPESFKFRIMVRVPAEIHRDDTIQLRGIVENENDKIDENYCFNNIYTKTIEEQNMIKLQTFGAKCPYNPVTKLQMTQCMNYRRLDERGIECRNKSFFINKQLIDDKNDEYCSIYGNAEDCSCIARSTRKEYNIEKQDHPFDDYCWYEPCSSPGYLINHGMEKKKNCNINLCVVKNSVDKTGMNVNQNDNQVHMNCFNNNDDSSNNKKKNSRF